MLSWWPVGGSGMDILKQLFEYVHTGTTQEVRRRYTNEGVLLM